MISPQERPGVGIDRQFVIRFACGLGRGRNRLKSGWGVRGPAFLNLRVGTDELSSQLFQKSAQHRWSSIRCLQQSIVIRRARSVERAIEAAKRRFERHCHMVDWRLHADGVELEMDQRSRVH